MSHDDYFTIKQGVSNSDLSHKQELYFNNNLRSLKDIRLKSGVLSKPFLRDLNPNSVNLAALPIFSDETITNTKLALNKDLNFFPNELIVESADEGYEPTKHLNYLYYLNYKNLLSGLFNSTQPLSYTTVFDNFRSDYEDPYLYIDGSNSSSKVDNLNILDSQNELNNNTKLSNPFKLRSTVKNSIVTYSAIQKVFRSRFDEGRSNTRLGDFSNSFVKHPYITDNRVKYEAILGKNKEAFLEPTLYNHTSKINLSSIPSVFYSNNIYFMDLPFLVSMKSDPTRYLWFD
jgi:hypothetical protein